MKQNYVFYIIVCLFTISSYAQREASYWYFGSGAGLNFGTGSPVAVEDGSLITTEGCASISDVDGNLLFYTDGSRVWNRNHAIMPTGFGLFGHPSSTQSAIIVPKPLDENIYYVFTVDWSGGENGLNYYTIDMTLDGGLGNVVGAPNQPTANLLLPTPVSEKITAVKVKDEEAFWVISFTEGRFSVFKVDENGVDSTPVTGNDIITVIEDARGYLKVSPDGEKLVSANMSSGTYVYDFDSTTGIVSNSRNLNLEGAFGYGAEFSPLSKKLYISVGNFTRNGSVAEEILYQFSMDLPTLTSETINDSRVELHRYSNARAALQLGLDGKIYRAINNSSFLGVINNPDIDGAGAGYQHNAIALGVKRSTQGLPPFIQSFFAAVIQVVNNCVGDETEFTIESNEPITSIIWDFGDGSPTSNELSPRHAYTATGDYILTVNVSTADETKEITQTITIFEKPIINENVDLLQCDDDTDGITSFNLTEALPFISTDPDLIMTFYETYDLAVEGDAINTIFDARSYENSSNDEVFVRVQNVFGCAEIATVNLRVSTTVIPDDFMHVIRQCDNTQDGDDRNGLTTFDFSASVAVIENLFPANQNLRISFYQTMTDGLREQNEIDPSRYRTITPNVQQLVVRVESEDNNACLGLGYFLTLQVDKLPEFDLAELAYVCENKPLEPVTLQAENPSGIYTYEWKDQTGAIIGTQSAQDFIIPGFYTLTATNEDQCVRTKSVEIRNSNIATFDDIRIEDDTENNTITVIVSGDGDYEFALDDGSFQDDNVFYNVPSGIVNVQVRDKFGCGIVEKEVAVIGFPKFLTPNGDGFNDTWQIDGVSFQPESLIYIYDRFGKVISKLDPTGEGWDGRYRGKQMPDSDYWFQVQLQDGRIFKGHFSLIRK